MGSGRDETTNKAVVCGVGTIFIMGCLYFFGIPFFFIGIAFLATADGDSGLVAGGVVMLVLAVIMVVAGIITCYYTVKLGNKASAERRQRQVHAGVVHTGPTVTVYPGTQQVPIQQYPGQPVQYTYTAAPPVVPQYPQAVPPGAQQYPPSTISGLPDYVTATASYPDPSVPEKY